VLAVLTGSIDLAFAQSAQPQALATPVAVRVSAAGGSVRGVVRDDAGEAVGEVMVIAMGTVIAAASSDRLGRFTLPLPPGEYILRASRDGYVSTLREPVRIYSSAPIERNILLIRRRTADAAPAAIEQLIAGTRPDDHAHSDLAWRLRHLRPNVLRDEAPARGRGEADAASAAPRAPDAVSLFDRAFHGSARAATAFFRDTDFIGQVNWVTTGSVDLSGAAPAASFSGSVAYLAVGAPVGTHGAWSVRGALAPGEPSSWVLLGEYEAEADERHAFRAGVSYGALRPGHLDPSASTMALAGARTAGAVYGFDRWRVAPGVEIAYGLRLDSYDYVAGSPLLSPTLGARVALIERIAVTVEGVHLAVAPGAAEFQPPASAGLWMPPERTFSSLRQSVPLRAERVQRLAVGLERVFGDGDEARTVKIRRFREATDGQLATFFGLGRRGAAHYVTAAVGDVELDGWTVGVAGRLAPGLRGSVDYSIAGASWQHPHPTRLVGRLAPSSVRTGTERLHDLAASLDADVPGTSTRVSMAYRVSSGFSLTRQAAGPNAGGRFSLEVRHELPYQPLRGGTLDLLVGIRNLYQDIHEAGSLYDELLTVSPPTRFIGGIQVRF
jgi:hypothetical protein